MRIVVIGGRGFLGSRAVSALRGAPGVEVVVASRRAGAGELVVDLARPETFAALDGADVVVDASNSHAASPDALAAHVLARGGVLLEASSDEVVVARLLEKRREAADRGALVLGAGIFTGVSNALARAAIERQPGSDELVMGVRTSPFSGAGSGTVDLMTDVLVRPTTSVVDGALALGPSVARGPTLPFVEGEHATLHVPFAEPRMIHASTKVPNVTMHMAPSPGFLRASFLALPVALLRMGWFLALMRLYFSFLRRFVLRSLGTRVGLVATARRRGTSEETTLALTVDDGFALAGAAIAASALVLAEQRASLHGVLVVDEVVPLETMLARARALVPSMKIETRGFALGVCAVSERENVALVLGGAGFVGRRLVALAAGEPVEANDRPSGWPRFDRIRVLDTAPLDASVVRAASIPIESVVGDITRPEDVQRALAGVQTVFHLASVVDVGLRPGPRIEAVNVGGTRNVVEACLRAGVRTLVYTSSEDVVLSEVPVAWGDESFGYPTRPIHPYVATKIEGEKLARAAHGQGALRTVAIRPVHVYGPDDPHAIVTSLRAFAASSVPFLVGHPGARFDIVYVDNVAHAHLLAASALERDPVRVGGRAYFVGEDRRPNYFEFLRPYAERRGIRVPRTYLGRRGTALAARAMELWHGLTGREVPFHRFHQRVIGEDFFFSNEAARRDLGYAPLVSPEEGQRRTLAWVDGVAL